MTVRLRVPAVDDPQFVADYDDRARVLKLIGSADNATAAGLGRLLDDLHVELLGKHAPQVVVDLRDLDFLGTACVTELVTWIEKLEDLAERYTITLRSNPAIAWQRTTLPALSCFDTALVTVET
ncbi:MAG: hypothetical protein ABI467_02850 [Kofleriaceae bacterium]